MPTKKSPTKKSGSKKKLASGLSAKGTESLIQGRARTVIYCHGIGNKPDERQLRSDWDHALFGSDQGERTRMAYWVDRQRYPLPEGPGSRTLSVPSELVLAPPEAVLEQSIEDSDSPDASRKMIASLEAELEKSAVKEQKLASANKQPRAKQVEVNGFWSPITWIGSKLFLADVNDFLFNKAKRDRMVKTVKDRLATGGGPFVVIGHSQGAMVVYQALMELGNSVKVDLLVTLGAPLGLPQVTGELKKWHGKQLPFPAGVKRWVNGARNGDIVCADKTLGDEYKSAGKTVEDFYIKDWDRMAKAHSIAYYLTYPNTREAIASAVDRSRFQQVSAFTISRALAERLDEDSGARSPVLIELVDRDNRSASEPQKDYLKSAKQSVLEWIDSHVGNDESTHDAIQLEDSLSRYVAAHLTRSEVETLAAKLGEFHGAASPSIYRMFVNSRKKALMNRSVSAIQAPTARLGYRADGSGITWAVLDTGIDSSHPHFNQEGNIAATWDCTKRGKNVSGGDKDPNGHGSHVAGIIAGGIETLGMISVAPKCRLTSYKVLSDDGGGNDAWIIKAIEHIWEQNEASRRLVIQGVNLSLGGPFDAASFGCGDSPLCSSLFRLIRQGVVVVIAAGNEGIGDIVVNGYNSSISLDLSIGDPANLDEAIAVGSVHATLPHRYGTSYFSSRGPTADGRLKPDVVAPGERIASCRSGARTKANVNASKATLYVEQSGTSMAAPHVSGLLAAFLSVRTEFIGHPDKVKTILMENCTDLKRDRYHQGAGLPNLAKMLLNT
jgi:subtilisin family serine protease